MRGKLLFGTFAACAIACGGRALADDLALHGGDGGAASGSGEGDGVSGEAPETQPAGPSCAGDLRCNATSCCSNQLVQGTPFLMGRGEQTDAFPLGYSDEQPEHEVTVPSYYLDTYEVTVGRFRKFLGVYEKPKPGVGAHPRLPGSGWDPAWDAELPDTAATLASLLKCKTSTYGAPDYPTWTDTPIDEEGRPINCVTWYELFAFCAWDGGRLPTEAEWELAAAGGSQNRLYPWGGEKPAPGHAAAGCSAYGCTYDSLPDTGSKPLGKGRWGQQDLAGSVWEWTLDWHTKYTTAGCGDCINYQAGGTQKVIRGGGYFDIPSYLRSAFRYTALPRTRGDFLGGRCARD